MASNISKFTIRTALKGRNYSSPSVGILNSDLKATTLANKVVVAASETCSPLSRISVQFKAGSRYECPDTAGAAHMLRICAGLSTANASQFKITRHIQQQGGNLVCSHSREAVTYTLEGLPETIEELLPFLGEVATQQVFRPWEMDDNLNRVKLELALYPPQMRVLDLLHKAAFRTGLGNSLYMPKSQVGKLSSETMQHYMCENFRAGRAAVVGMGVDADLLSRFASQLPLQQGAGDNKQSAYKSGQIRSEKGGQYAYVALATEGSGFAKNLREALVFNVLKNALGGEPSVKRGVSAGSMCKSVGGGNHGITALNICYSDTGLFGALIAAESSEVRKLVEKAKESLTSGQVSDADVKRGKAQLIMQVLTRAETPDTAIDFLGTQALFMGKVVSPEDVVSEIDNIKTEEVSAAASKVAGGKLSMASVGDLRNVPYLDEL